MPSIDTKLQEKQSLVKFQITEPNFTQTPNVIIDEWLPYLSGLELKVLMLIVRKTFGWHKTRDRISNSQLSKFIGATEPKIRAAAKKLQERGIIRKEVVGSPGNEKTFYELVVAYNEKNSNNLDGVPKGPGGGSQKDPTKETIPKEKKSSSSTPPKSVSPKSMSKQTASPKKASPEEEEKASLKEKRASPKAPEPSIHPCLKPLSLSAKKAAAFNQFSPDIVEEAMRRIPQDTSHIKVLSSWLLKTCEELQVRASLTSELSDSLAKNRAILEKYRKYNQKRSELAHFTVTKDKIIAHSFDDSFEIVADVRFADFESRLIKIQELMKIKSTKETKVKQ